MGSHSTPMAAFAQSGLNKGTSHRNQSCVTVTEKDQTRIVNLFKSEMGFGFTFVSTPRGHIVRQTADSLRYSQLLKPGDVILRIDGVDVRKESHETIVSLLKSYPPGSQVKIFFHRPSASREKSLDPFIQPRPHSAVPQTLLSHPFWPQPLFEDIDQDLNHKTLTKDQSPSVANDQRKTFYTNTKCTTLSTRPIDPIRPVHPAYTNFLEHSTGNELRNHYDVSKDNQYLGKDINEYRPAFSNPQRALTPHAFYENQKQYRTKLASVSSNLNFSGTPDFIPASLYNSSSGYSSFSSTPVGEEQNGFRQGLDKKQTVANIDASRSYVAPAGGFLSSSGVSEDTHWDAAVTRKKPSVEERRVRRHSALGLSNKTLHATNIAAEDRAERTTPNHVDRPMVYPEPIPFRVPNSHQRENTNDGYGAMVDRTTRNINDHQLLRGRAEPVTNELIIYQADIHRGSRGFGFSIRGGREFGGMSLFVLNIAEGGPAQMDGRMKNGDQILSINGLTTEEMTHKRAIELIQNSCSPISLVMKTTVQTKRHPMLVTPRIQMQEMSKYNS